MLPKLVQTLVPQGTLEDNPLGCYLQGVIQDQGSSNHFRSLSHLRALLCAETPIPVS